MFRRVGSFTSFLYCLHPPHFSKKSVVPSFTFGFVSRLLPLCTSLFHYFLPRLFWACLLAFQLRFPPFYNHLVLSLHSHSALVYPCKVFPQNCYLLSCVFHPSYVFIPLFLSFGSLLIPRYVIRNTHYRLSSSGPI